MVDARRMGKTLKGILNGITNEVLSAFICYFPSWMLEMRYLRENRLFVLPFSLAARLRSRQTDRAGAGRCCCCCCGFGCWGTDMANDVKVSDLPRWSINNVWRRPMVSLTQHCNVTNRYWHWRTGTVRKIKPASRRTIRWDPSRSWPKGGPLWPTLSTQ